MASVLPNGKQQYFGDDGLPLVGGQLFTYAAGTLTPKDTYQDADATVQNTNPIILDSRGEALVFWSGTYDITLTDSLGTLIYSVPGITEPDVAFRTSPNGSAIIPAGATIQRDDPAELGYFRYNTDLNEFEGYYDSGWSSFQKELVSGTNIKTINGASLLGSGDLKIPATLKSSNRDSVANTPIVQGDLSTLIAYTGAVDFTQLFPLAANLEDGFWYIARNDGTMNVTIQANDVPIDGLTSFVMYPGECRLYQFSTSDGFNTIVLEVFKKRWTVSDTFIKPPRYKDFLVTARGAGGGGGGGEGRIAGAARSGGAGGGGGANFSKRFGQDQFAVSSTITIGAGGIAGAGGNLAAGGNGGIGGSSALISNAVTLITSFGGGGGMGGVGASVTGGGSGGGTGGPGGVGTVTGVAGGLPSNASIGTNTAGLVSNSGGGGAATSATNSGNAENGGGGGAVLASTGTGAFSAGGSSLSGGAGGGAGGSFNAANTGASASNGGASMRYTVGGGAGGGTNGVTGTGGFNGSTVGVGAGGGGAGGGSAGVGGQGGAGYFGGGGGGGGAGTGVTGGPGGDGGGGFIEIEGVV